VPEDRTHDGLVGSFSVAENLILDRSADAAFSVAGTIRRGALDRFARDRIAEFDIRTQGPQTRAGALSGGNQQKVVIARELNRELKLFLASQPTRGVDVGSIEFIHKRIIDTRDAGIPVIVVSTELDEVTALADRIAVMYRGAIVGIVPGDTPRDVLGLMMAGEAAA
jgi:simple sugar transport system ATP-binding protein